MEILNLKVNNSLSDWGCKITSTQKPIAWKDKTQKYDVYKIPIDILVYNAKNGRMFMEARKFESDQGIQLEKLKKEDPKRFNDEVENIIWSTNSERNIGTKRDIEKFGQLEPGVVLDDGTVIDGNRRFTCLRRLHREYPDDERFQYFEAAIVEVDGVNITNKLLKEYELRVQFGADEKVNYNVVNMNMSLYELIEKNDSKDFDYTTVAELVNKSPGDIAKICKVCALIDEFLIYIKKEGEYQIAEDMNIYWPLEPLVTYFDNDGKNLSPLQKIERKHLYFDYLLTLDLSLMTQNLRDNLIKKVFKNIDETEDLISEHKETIGDDIQQVIDESDSVEEFKESIKKIKNSDKASKDKDNYETKVNKELAKKQIDIPLKECANALKCLKNVNLKHLLNSSNLIALTKVEEIEDTLNQISVKVSELKKEIDDNKQ